MGLDRFSRTYIVLSMAVGSARPRMSLSVPKLTVASLHVISIHCLATARN
jgi:hypothetical protein